MKSTSTSDSKEMNMHSETIANADQSSEIASTPMTGLKELTLRLIREVQSIAEGQMPSFDNGFDFYAEVSRFEIDLIRLALLQTGGHQRRAARLLNLKVTTLNSKIKHYNINLDEFDNAYPILMKTKLESPQFA